MMEQQKLQQQASLQATPPASSPQPQLTSDPQPSSQQSTSLLPLATSSQLVWQSHYLSTALYIYLSLIIIVESLHRRSQQHLNRLLPLLHCSQL